MKIIYSFLALSKIDVVNVVHIAVSLRCKMMSLVNKSADWPPPNYHKTAKAFPQM